MNQMKLIRLEKVTLNIGAGKDQNRLDKARMLIKNITGIEPVKTITKKRIPTWGLRPGLPIGCKLTLRHQNAIALLRRLLTAKDKTLLDSQFDNLGNISFGIHEYIDIPDAKYDPKVGIMGLQVCVTLERRGFRIKKRALRKGKISKKHIISKNEAIEYMTKEYDISIGEQ